MDNLFYIGSKWKIGNKDYPMYICKGIRSRGKTTVWLAELVLWWERNVDDNKFIYVRRKDVEMDLALDNGLFNNIRKAVKEGSTDERYIHFANRWVADDYRDGKIYLIDKDGNRFHCGYYFTLNNVKGISIEDSNVMLFDEYVAPTRSEYKGGEGGSYEPTLMLRLCETIFRRKNFWVIMLGNNDCPTNPYDEYYHIPFNATKYRIKNKLWYEWDTSEATIEQKKNTTIGRLSVDTPYGDYTLNGSSIQEVSDDLICGVVKHAKQGCNVKIFGSVLTLWVDEISNVEYITDDRKINNQYPILCVSTNDMSIDTNFIQYSSQFLLMQKMYYAKGKVRFNSQKTASLYLTMLSLI